MHEGHNRILFGMVTYSTPFCSNDFCFAFSEAGVYLLFLGFQFDVIEAKNVFDRAHLR